MSSFENKFVIRLITKSTDEDYVNALKIYSGTTPMEIRTNSNEITYWLNKKDDNNPFELLVFVLYLDGIVVGFSQLTYILSQKAVILDYVSLKDEYRVNTIFLVFLSMIQNYLSASVREIIYYIAEISNKDCGTNIDKESAFYKRIICHECFGEVKSKYLNLPLGLDNHESNFESIMYLKTNDKIANISIETFLSLVKAICYEYYFVWYKEFLTSDKYEEYKVQLDNCFQEIQKAVSANNRIAIVYPSCPLFNVNVPVSTSGAIPNIKKPHVKKTPLLIGVIVIMPIVLAVFYNYIFPLLNMQFGSISSFVGGLIGTLAASFIAFSAGKKSS